MNLISQNELRKLEGARKTLSKAEAEEKRVRARLLKKHNEGESVEVGRLCLKVSSRSAMQYRTDEVRAALSRSEFQKLKAATKPTLYQRLTVEQVYDWPYEPAGEDEAYPY